MSLLPTIASLWPIYRAPILTASVTLAGAGLARALHRPLPVAPLAILVGWVMLAWPGFPARPPWAAVLSPAQLTDFLLLPAILVAAHAAFALRGKPGRRWVRWSPVLLGFLISWWIAGMPPGHREFWRVWAGTALVLWLLHRGIAGRWERAVAAVAGLAGGLIIAGAPWAWSLSALVLLASGPAPAMLIGVGAAAAALGAGRVVRGILDPVDVACLAALSVPWVMPRLLTSRPLRHLTRTRTGAAIIAGAGLVWAVTWLAVRLGRPPAA